MLPLRAMRPKLPVLAHRLRVVLADELLQAVDDQVEDALTLLFAGDQGVAHGAGDVAGVAAALGEGGEGAQLRAERVGEEVRVALRVVDEMLAQVKLDRGLPFAAVADTARVRFAPLPHLRRHRLPPAK